MQSLEVELGIEQSLLEVEEPLGNGTHMEVRQQMDWAAGPLACALGRWSGRNWAIVCTLGQRWSGAIQLPNRMDYFGWSRVKLVEWSDYFESRVLPNRSLVPLG